MFAYTVCISQLSFVHAALVRQWYASRVNLDLILHSWQKVFASLGLHKSVLKVLGCLFQPTGGCAPNGLWQQHCLQHRCYQSFGKGWLSNSSQYSAM